MQTDEISVSEPHVVVPEWMTPEQVASIARLYKRGSDGAVNQAEFFRRVENYGDYCGLAWCGMFVGIERNGYTHT